MEPNYLDMSVDSLEASMAREILEASIREAAEPRREPGEAASKTDSETPKGTNDNDDIDHQTSKLLDQSLNLMDLSLGPALTAGSSVESPNLGTATLSTQHEMDLEVTDAIVGDIIKQLDDTSSPLDPKSPLNDGKEDQHESEVEEQHQQAQHELQVDEKELQHQEQEMLGGGREQQQVLKAQEEDQQQSLQNLDGEKEQQLQQQPEQQLKLELEVEEQEQLAQPQQQFQTELELEVREEEQQPQLDPSQELEVEKELQPQLRRNSEAEEKEQQHEVQVEASEDELQPQKLSFSSGEAIDSTINDVKRESVISVVPAKETAAEISGDSRKSDASDQGILDKADVEEEVKEEKREEEEEEEPKEKVKAEEKDKEEDEDDEESCESDRVILDDDCSEEDEELSDDQTQQQPSFQTAAGGYSVAADPSIVDQSNTTNYMEFTKNYSDDLLMGGGGQASSGEGVQHGHDMMPNADLADFELPPYSGSSSGSENQQQQQQSSSPIKSSQAQASSSATASSSRLHTNTQASPPSLTAVIELLMASYSRGAHLLQWKRPIETGIIFGIGATFIMALTFFSIISVIAYSALGLILASASIRLYKTLMKTLNKSTDTPVDHIWNKALALNVSISSDKLYELVDASHGNLNSSMAYFKQVLLIEDKIAAIKFGIFLYILTYIGSWFNGMTLITIGYLALFSVPILYQQNKTKIDELLNMITGQMSSTIGMVTSRVSALAFGGPTSDSKKKN